MTPEPDAKYSSAAITLHWLTATLVVANLLLGLSMVPLPISPQKLEWYIVHKWIGITIFLVTSTRIAWRLIDPPPPPGAMPDWQRRSAKAVHALLYALLLLIPLSGWLYSSATGVQVVYLGVVPLPDLVGRDRELGKVLRVIHLTLNFTMFVLVCVHIVAALKHHLVDRDTVLARMLPMTRPKGKLG